MLFLSSGPQYANGRETHGNKVGILCLAYLAKWGSGSQVSIIKFGHDFCFCSFGTTWLIIYSMVRVENKDKHAMHVCRMLAQLGVYLG